MTCWDILQERCELFLESAAYVQCDRRQQLLIIHHPSMKNLPASSASSILSGSDHGSVVSRLTTISVGTFIPIQLERIQYIQRADGSSAGRSARNYDANNHQQGQTNRNRQQPKLLEIFYCEDRARSEYLYKNVLIQLRKSDEELDKWINALYEVMHESKNLNEAAKRNRWLLREYEKLRNSRGGLTFDSINGWLNSHLGLFGEKSNVEKLMKQDELFRQSNEITDTLFNTIYYFFVKKQQDILTKMLMSDIVDDGHVVLEKFASRVTNNRRDTTAQELYRIKDTLHLEPGDSYISPLQSFNYLWSDANSAFDPVSRTTCIDDLDQPLNRYWISSSHNTYLAKTQLFNPSSIHCYIQALLKGCRCIEIDVFDPRTGKEPEITHKGTRIKPIPLRGVLEAIIDYAFITSEYPVIISIENHCSPLQRSVMARMFIEIFGDSLIQAPLSPNELELPSPNKLKRKIILKDSKMSALLLSPQSSVEADEQSDISTSRLEGHVQLYNASKKNWVNYNYTAEKDNIYLAQVYDLQKIEKSYEDMSDDEPVDVEKDDSKDGFIQIWYHGNISHEQARRLFLENAGYEVGTFLIRRSQNKNCYCLTYLAPSSAVKSIEIQETITADGECLYSLADRTFDSIPDLVAAYRTYNFADAKSESNESNSIRLGRPVPRPKWYQELKSKKWYQPDLTRRQAEELLREIGEEMTFLIRKSSNRDRQDYSLSVYYNGGIRHSPIYTDGTDLMLQSKTFTSLVEIVDYYSHKPVFNGLTLQAPAKSYEEFLREREQNGTHGTNKHIIFQPLEAAISLQADQFRIRNIDGNSVKSTIQVELLTNDEDKTKPHGYLMKFDSAKECQVFATRRGLIMPPESPPLGPNPSRSKNNAISNESARMYLADYDKLIIYCQGVKLKDRDIARAQDLLEKIKGFAEMVSLNRTKGATFCSDIRSMLQFNLNHFTRIYPDFNKQSWNSRNFDPMAYWVSGCQMVALNVQMPDHPMHLNAGRFAANGGSGYILMPDYIRSFDHLKPEIHTVSMLLKIRIIAVRHLRSDQVKSISKVYIRTSIDTGSKRKQAENQSLLTTIYGPCGVWDSKKSPPKQNDQLLAQYSLQSHNKDVDILSFEVVTDNEEFCGQSTIPLSCLRSGFRFCLFVQQLFQDIFLGIRSVQLYDKFNERLDLSALLVDINFQTM
ncbi:unnamed protein product [Adineta ricciae]|uniref:Phosphoinositide phospholipase C n=1 Tax=Adineta ricciae TaxID=249248 RepID=A0A814T3I6_ADIRI|nr:unnamed protein product [Adineta ricciae]